MMSERRLLAFLPSLLICGALLSGCANLGDQGTTMPRAADDDASLRSIGPASGVLAMLTTYRMLANAPLDQQRRAYLEAQATATRDFSANNRIRLALTLSLPGTPWRDDGKMMGILDAPPSLIRMPDSALQPLAFLLYRQAQDRQRLREEQRKRDNEAQEEQRRSRDEQRKREAEFVELQRQNEELHMKLDALRRIDQDIRHRRHGLEGTP